MAEILTGAPVAEAMLQSLLPRVERLKAAGVQPAGNAEQALQALQKQGLAVIIRDSDRSRHDNK